MEPASPHTLTPAALDWRDNGTPVSRDFGDVYFSADDGLAETRHVFLQGNRLAERWTALPRDSHGHFTLVETGFGAGLNALATLALWRDTAPPGWHLHYLAIEKHPLTPADLTRALAAWPDLAEPARALTAAYPPLYRGRHARVLVEYRCTLTWLFDDLIRALPALLDSGSPRPGAGFTVDAWFLDGFAPAVNPSMWDASLYPLLRCLSRPDTTAATFTAAGAVRRGLSDHGFAVARAPGFGRKRHCLTAVCQPPGDEPPPAPRVPDRVGACLPKQPAWHRPRPLPQPGRVAVVGAGLAGTLTAWSLQRRGWNVTLLDQAGPGAAASGNRRGVLFHRFSRHNEPLARFSLTACLFSAHWYRQAQDNGWLTPDTAQPSGCLFPADNPTQSEHYRALANAWAGTGLLRWLTPDAASEVAGAPLSHPALFFPHSGWVAPGRVCRQLADRLHWQPGRVTHLMPLPDHRWQLQQATASPSEPFDAVVLAIGTRTNRLADPLTHPYRLPLKPVRGQVSCVPATDRSAGLRLPVCHDGYLMPALDNSHDVGATFDLDSNDPSVTVDSHRDNLRRLRTHLPDLFPAPPDPETLSGRTAFRCTTPDYLPLIGPLPGPEAAPRNGLYLNTGHGSRGLSYAPLAAELLAGLMHGEPPLVDSQLLQAVAPARFPRRVRQRARSTARSEHHA